MGGLEEKQHALGDALGDHWGKSSKALVFHFGLCLLLWLSALQIPAQMCLCSGRNSWCKLRCHACLGCQTWKGPCSRPQLLSCQSQQL